MSVPRKRWIVVVLAALGLGGWIAKPYIDTAAFLLDVAGLDTPVRRWLPVRTYPVTTAPLSIPTRHGEIAARVYLPSPEPDRVAIVFPGVHGGGVDEPRLDAFARRLASTGLAVVSVPLPGLRAFRVTRASTDIIEDAAGWLADNSRLVPTGRVALIGVSFSGGLALVAAGRDSLSDKLEVVVSIGGYGDLPRALRYMCTGVMSDGTRLRPHDYSLAVIALAAVPRLVPADQQAGFERGILTYLEASLDETPPQLEGTRLLNEARAIAAGLPEPARGILSLITERDVVTLGPLLAPTIDGIASDPELSPERSRATRAPVFLLHGTADNVIPSSETPLLSTFLRAGNAHVHHLVTPLVTHAGIADDTTLTDAVRLIGFWKAARDW